jgi:nitrite reductase/ring-hydroxylating ferredoxin subunit
MQEQPTPPPRAEEGQGQQEDTRAGLTRRRLVHLGWISAILVAVGGQLWLLLKLFFAPITPGEGRGQFAIGTLDKFPVGSVKHFRKERCIVAHHPTGVLALSDECTHLKCTVDFLPERQVIFCPCHSAQFSTTGAVLAGPAPRPLERFVTMVRDGQVLVDTTQRLGTAPSPG